MAVELQKMITLQLHNITFSTMGLQMGIDSAKVSIAQCLISQNHRTYHINKLTTTLPSCTQKGRDREENQRRHKRKDITTLGSSGGVIVWLQPATKVPCGRPSPRWGAEENGKKEAETGGSG